MKEGYSEDDIYRRLLAGIDDNALIDNLHLRFIAKAFSHEMVLLRNEMEKTKEKILDAPYLVPPTLLATPVACQIRCRPLYGSDISELDREDTFISDNGMVFTPANRQNGGEGTVILENVEYRREKKYLSRQLPIFSIDIPANRVLLEAKVSGTKIKRIYDGNREHKVEGIMHELINRLSILPVIRDGLDNDILSPYCQRIINDLSYIGRYIGIEGSNNSNSVFFTVDFNYCDEANRGGGNFLELETDGDRRMVAVDYVLCSIGRLESGSLLKCNRDSAVHNTTMEVVDTVCCSYENADFGAAFRYAASWKRIWSLSDVRDSSLSLFPHVLKDVCAVKGSFIKQGCGAVSGIIVKLYMKEFIGGAERDFWRERVEEFITDNSPSTYNYMVLAE